MAREDAERTGDEMLEDERLRALVAPRPAVLEEGEEEQVARLWCAGRLDQEPTR